MTDEYTKEDILTELQNRGVNTSTLAPPVKTTYTPRNAAYTELKNRGMKDEDIVRELDKKPKSLTFWQSLVEEVPEFAGSIAGGLLFKSPAGAIIGAGIGGAVGRGATEIGQQITGAEPSKTPEEITIESAKAGGKQALQEVGGRLLVGAVGKILAPFRKAITPEAEEASKVLEKYMPKETSPVRLLSKVTGQKIPAILPHEATENRTLDLLYNVSEASIIGGKKIAEYKVIRQQAISDMLDDLTSQFVNHADPDQIGEAFVLAINKKLDTRKLITSPLYNTVSELSKNVKVPTKSLKDFVAPYLKTIKEIGGIESANAGDDLIKAVNELPDEISISAAIELRSRLISRADEYSVLNKKAPAIGKAKAMTGVTDNMVENALKTQNPEAYNLWREANRIYREGSEKYDNEFIRRLVKTAEEKGNPELIAQSVFKPGAISNIRRVKIAIDDITFNKLKGWYTNNLLRKSVNQEGDLKGTILWNNLYGKAGMGNATLKEIYKPEELLTITNVANTLKFIEKKQGEGTGKIFIQLSQAGAIVGMTKPGAIRKTAFAILGGPFVLSRVFTNPLFVKYLTATTKLPEGSPQIGAILTKMAGLALNIQRDVEKGKAFESTIDKYKREEITIKGGGGGGGSSILGSINEATRDLLNFVTKPSGEKAAGIDPIVLQHATQLGFSNPAVANATMEYIKQMARENPESLKVFKLLDNPIDRLKALMNLIKERGLVPLNK